MVVDAAARHVLERVRRDVQRRGIAAALPVAQQELDSHRLWELGRMTKAALLGVVLRFDATRRDVQDLRIELTF